MRKFIYIFLVIVIGFVLAPRIAHACWNCGYAGRIWCDGTTLKECVSCGGTCYYWEGLFRLYRNDCCTSDDTGGGSFGPCDFSCCPEYGPRLWARDIGTCAPPPACSGVLTLTPTCVASGTTVTASVTGVTNATSVTFYASSGTTFRIYTGTQSGSTWTAPISTSVFSPGTVAVSVLMSGPGGSNVFCANGSFTVAALPSAPTSLQVVPVCGGAGPAARFSWLDTPVAALKFILRVDNAEDGAWVGPYDYWRYVPQSLGSCSYSTSFNPMTGATATTANCAVTLDSTTPANGGGGFRFGNYVAFSVQTVDGCDVPKSSTTYPAFDFYNNITGRLFVTAGDCSENPASSTITDTSKTGVELRSTDSYGASEVWTSFPSSGVYTFSNATSCTSISSLSVQGVLKPTNPDFKYEPACAKESISSNFTTSGDSTFWANPAYALQMSDVTIDLGFRLVNGLSIGWFTSKGGVVFSGSDISETVPSAPAGLSGHLMDANTPDGIALSKGGLDVETTQGEERVVAADGSYIENMNSSFTLIPEGFSYDAPGSAIAINGLSAGLNPDNTYVIDASKLTAYIDTGNGYNCNSVLTKQGTLSLYVRDDGWPLRINKGFCAFGNDLRRVVLIVARSVEIGRAVDGIGATIISAGDIKVIGTTNATTDPDRILNVRGALISGKIVRFQRNLGEMNSYPAEIVQYDPRYIYSLSQHIRENPEVHPSLSLSHVEWVVED